VGPLILVNASKKVGADDGANVESALYADILCTLEFTGRSMDSHQEVNLGGMSLYHLQRQIPPLPVGGRSRGCSRIGCYEVRSMTPKSSKRRTMRQEFWAGLLGGMYDFN
jgi:hypothetical protein